MTQGFVVSRDLVTSALYQVMDPEIDSVSIMDLGMVGDIKVDGGNIQIHLLPTFLGCPALEIIKSNTKAAIKKIPGVLEVEVDFIYHPPWTSERITKQGHLNLRKFGIAPPPQFKEGENAWHVDCAYCGSTYTTLENLFGPTACRSILYCKNCKNVFEAMKPISTIM